MQNPSEFILESLKSLRGVPVERPDVSSNELLVAFISKAVVSKKFRKYSVDADFVKSLDRAVRLNVTNNEPIKFALPFGGYKLWRLDEAPEVDWAEFFTLMYFTQWLKPITENYKPGVWFDFSSDDVIVERLDNIPKKDTDAYAKSFRNLVSFLEPFIPENLRFTFTSVGSRYTQEEFTTELEQKKKEILNSLGGLPEVSEREQAMIELNTRPREGEIRDTGWYQENKLLHDAYASMSKRRSYYRTVDKLVAFTRRLPNGVAIGTTKTSIAKFWVGVGVLKKRDAGYIESVLSPDQLQKAVYSWEPITIPGLHGKNFARLRIVEA